MRTPAELKEDIGFLASWYPELAEPACDDCPDNADCCVAFIFPNETKEGTR